MASIRNLLPSTAHTKADQFPGLIIWMLLLLIGCFQIATSTVAQSPKDIQVPVVSTPGLDWASHAKIQATPLSAGHKQLPPAILEVSEEETIERSHILMLVIILTWNSPLFRMDTPHPKPRSKSGAPHPIPYYIQYSTLKLFD